MKDRPSRDDILRDLWLRRGCPEKMTIHVRKTGETITLINGLPVTDSGQNSLLLIRSSKPQNRESRVRQAVTDNRHCELCRNEFSSTRKDAKYCSPRCRQRAVRRQAALQLRQEAEQLLASINLDRCAGA